MATLSKPLRRTYRTYRWLWLAIVLALFATACGGEVDSSVEEADVADSTPQDSATENSTPEDSATQDSTPEDSSDVESADSESADSDGGPNIYVDPRGGIFADFQAGFDRANHPFTQLDAFCNSHDAATDRIATDPGIGADTISLAHIRTRLEDAVELGFGIPVGDPAHMFEVLVDYVNTECGGIRGRQIELVTLEVPAFGGTVETDRNAACIEATEDNHAVIIMNSTSFQGAATLCITEEKETIFISTQSQSEEFMKRANGRLISIANTSEESLRFNALDVIASGALDGLVVGVATPDVPGQPEAVQAGLVDTLEAAGIEVVFDQLGCAGGTVCLDGVADSVSNMRQAGVTAFFNVMNIFTAPAYIDEMVLQGFQPGEVQFFATDFNNQSSELVSGQIANSPDAGNLYSGATIRDFRGTGLYRNDGYEPSAWQTLCTGLYNEINTIGASHVWQDQGGDSGFGMAVSICSILRIALRALYDAGDNPTRADVLNAIENLGPVDIGQMIPSSVTPGKGQAPDAHQTMDWTFPCDQPFPYTRGEAEPICLTGRDDWRLVPR